MQEKPIEKMEAEIYEQYQNVIAPYIAELEVRDGEYPIEILNEIRSIFTHLSRCKLQNNLDEIESANRHVKRAILDCYKYICISIAQTIFEFRQEYIKVDLTLADNGKFLVKLNDLELIAKNAFEEAKKSEIKQESTETKYKLYEKAYNAYNEVEKFIEDSNEAILFASSHSKKSNRITIISCIITVISIIVTIAVTVIAIL